MVRFIVIEVFAHYHSLILGPTSPDFSWLVSGSTVM